ncbi:YbaK/EbsC family protein [Secundilactobacillus collinoides]|uniref:YbaK/aminoacyl-tRNA synthetase-associated domain-containing protein n=2 Tax=Secundilactobacillus collinoides TaxID=33960 RepID=A0A0R2B9L9_SECCO|nr:YbaK/EbsC family protein [Secundilactobacillus collinoides]KRM75847.1 hypothetical protein FC82_GL001998 [Secundilactobacillus collinoides DSM 20515 = JCM 1123]KZL37164.1 prolyl-tRNA synthetase [Secundilactobacillus collinoides]
MSLEAVEHYFEPYHLTDRIHVFHESTATVAEAAATLGIEPDQIAKTLAFDVGGENVVVVASGLSRIANGKFKRAFGKRADMIARDEVETRIGHAVGGVCPFAVKPDVKVYLDESLKKYDILYPAAGDTNAAIRLSLTELERYSNPVGWVDVAKDAG